MKICILGCRLSQRSFMSSLGLAEKLMLFSKTKAIPYTLHFVTIKITYVVLLRYESKLCAWKFVFFSKVYVENHHLFVWYNHYLSFNFQDFSISFVEKGSTNFILKQRELWLSWKLTAGSTAEKNDNWLSQRRREKMFLMTLRKVFFWGTRHLTILF